MTDSNPQDPTRNDAAAADPQSPDEMLDEDMIEIDWQPLQGAIDAMAEDLDFEDNEALLYHLGALLGSLLSKVAAEEEIDELGLAETAAEIAAFAVDLASGEDELPPFLPSDAEEDSEEDSSEDDG